MGEQAAWGRSAQTAFEDARFRLLLSGTPFRSDNTPIPWITYGDDGVSRADFAYGYTDALLDGVCRPVTFHTYDGDMEWMSDGRRRRADFSVGLPAAEAARRLRTALDPEGDWMAQVLRDADAAPDRPALRPAPRGRRARGGDRHGARRPPRRAARAGQRRAPGDRDLRDRRRLGADRALRRRVGPLARLGADGLRGRRRAAAARRRLRDDRAHGAVLPPGRRALRAPDADAARADEPPLPRLRPAAEGSSPPRSRRSATTRSSRRRRARRSPSSASAPRRARRSGRCGRAPAATTTSCAPPRPATRCSCSPTRPPAAAAAPRWPPSPPPRPARRARRASRAHDRRERLRDERRALVAAVSRRTGEAHRVIHGRINRETGAASVTAASVDQLERGNRLLERQAKRRSLAYADDDGLETLAQELHDIAVRGRGTSTRVLLQMHVPMLGAGVDRDHAVSAHFNGATLGDMRPPVRTASPRMLLLRGTAPSARRRPHAIPVSPPRSATAPPTVARCPPARGPALRADGHRRRHRRHRLRHRDRRRARTTASPSSGSTSRRSRTTTSPRSRSRTACAGAGPTTDAEAGDAEVRATLRRF